MEPDKRGLFKLVVFVKDAKIGRKFNTVPFYDPEANQWEIIEVTNEKFSAVSKDDCLYVFCKYLGPQN